VLTQLEDVDRRQGGGYRLHGKLTDPYGIYPTPRSHDWVVITLDNEALGLSNVTISSLPDPRAKPDEQELAFVSEPIALEDATAQKLKKTAGVRIPGSRYKVFTDYGSPSDLFSLGVILLTLLVGNDRQDAKAIAGEVERFSKGLAGSRDASDGPFEAAKALLEKDGEAARAFGKANIFFHELDREETRPNAIPKELWARAVLLGLRLATRVAGFSVCSDRSDYDEVHPTAKLEATLQEASLLAAEVRSLLFQRQASHLEVQQVLSEVLAQQVPSPRAAR
jgi:hypothetical protein